MAKKLTLSDFIEKSRKLHGEEYDYSLVNYSNSRTKVCIICFKHGQFWQTPTDHYLSGCGCQKCDKTRRLTTEEFVEKSIKLHGEKYDYHLTEYKESNNENVIIVCLKHGEFKQKPQSHLRGQGCPNCAKNKNLSTPEFIQKAILKHKDVYDYSRVKYSTKNEKVSIICKKHGLFKQNPCVHLRGHGCQICRNSKLENFFRNELINRSIKHEQNKRFSSCRNVLTLSFDFYLPEKNLLIELDGIQHFSPIKRFGGYERFELQKKLDSIKNQWCLENKIELVRFSKIEEIKEFFFKNLINRNFI